MYQIRSLINEFVNLFQMSIFAIFFSWFYLIFVLIPDKGNKRYVESQTEKHIFRFGITRITY